MNPNYPIEDFGEVEISKPLTFDEMFPMELDTSGLRPCHAKMIRFIHKAITQIQASQYMDSCMDGSEFIHPNYYESMHESAYSRFGAKFGMSIHTAMRNMIALYGNKKVCRSDALWHAAPSDEWIYLEIERNLS
jgi:hypothetical protein